MASQQSKGSRPRMNGASPRIQNKDFIDPAKHSDNGGRHRMIAEAAYYRALRRDLQGGDPVEDWLEAEREVTSRLVMQVNER